MEKLCKRLQNKLFWNNSKASKAITEYQKYMEMKAQTKDFDAEILSPALPINAVWHMHILDTKDYRQFCQNLCGQMIHHDPEGGMDPFARSKRIESTKKLYKENYGIDPPGNIWNFDSE